MTNDLMNEYNKSLELDRKKLVESSDTRMYIDGVEFSGVVNSITVDHDSGFHNTISSHESITGYATTESSIIGILYPNTLECDEDGLTLRSPNGEHSIRITNEGITLTGTLRSETRE